MQLGDYIIKPDCKRDENKLINFLKFNNFRYCKRFEYNPIDNDYLIVVNVIHRYYFEIDKYFLTGEKLSIEEFFEKIHYYENGKVVHKKLFSNDKLLYEGYTVNDKPYGLGTLYFENGTKYKEGIFDIKGIIEGKEYYPKDQVKFEGTWSITTGYGYNAPYKGSLFNEKGKLIFSGKFEINKCGVGAPMIRYPTYGRDPENRPKIEYIHSSDLKKANVKSRSEIINWRCFESYKE